MNPFNPQCYILQVLHVMSFMIEVVGVGIQPHAAPLAQYLPGLWDESADHNMLRCAILTTLVHMVTGLMVSITRYFLLIPLVPSIPMRLRFNVLE